MKGNKNSIIVRLKNGTVTCINLMSYLFMLHEKKKRFKYVNNIFNTLHLKKGKMFSGFSFSFINMHKN